MKAIKFFIFAIAFLLIFILTTSTAHATVNCSTGGYSLTDTGWNYGSCDSCTTYCPAGAAYKGYPNYSCGSPCGGECYGATPITWTCQDTQYCGATQYQCWITPVTKINTPADQTSEKSSFTPTVSDTGGSAAPVTCYYGVFDGKTSAWTVSYATARTCNSIPQITVGTGSNCNPGGTCVIYAYSKDRFNVQSVWDSKNYPIPAPPTSCATTCTNAGYGRSFCSSGSTLASGYSECPSSPANTCYYSFARASGGDAGCTNDNSQLPYCWCNQTVAAASCVVGTTCTGSGYAPAKPTLSSPSSGATGISTTPTLSWNPASGAQCYAVYLTGGTSYSTTTTTTTASVPSASALNYAAGYTWDVLAYPNSTCTGTVYTTSDQWTFTTAAPSCPAPAYSNQGFGSTENSMTLSLQKDSRISSYNANWCMNEHGIGTDFSSPYCCSNPNGCSKSEIAGSADSDKLDSTINHIDFEHLSNNLPNALFSGTHYNMQAQSVCANLNLTSATLTITGSSNNWYCALSSNCWSTQPATNSDFTTTAPRQTVTFYNGASSCNIYISPYGQDAPNPTAGGYGNVYNYKNTTTYKWEFSDYHTSSHLMNYGAAFWWINPADGDSNRIDVHSKVYRRQAGDNANIGFTVDPGTCNLKRWDGVSQWVFVTSPFTSTILMNQSNPQNLTNNDLLERYQVNWAKLVTIKGQNVDTNISLLSSDIGQNITITGVTTGTINDYRSGSSYPGNWDFTSIPAGTYNLTAAIPNNYTVTYSTSLSGTYNSYTSGQIIPISLTNNGDTTNLYFKYSPLVTIMGHNMAADGVTDLVAPSIGQKISVTGQTDNTSLGAWDFSRIPAGSYTVSATIPTGYLVSYRCNNAVTLTNNQPCPMAYTSSGNSLSVTLPNAGNSADIYFKYTPAYTVSGEVFVDADRSGTKNGTEGDYVDSTGSNPAKVTISTSPTQTVTTTNGIFSFANIPAGNYSLTLTTVPSGYVTTTNPLNISIAANSANNNFGIDTPKVTIQGRNKAADGTDLSAAIPGLNITLSPAQTIDAVSNYLTWSFSRKPAGIYTVKADTPPGYTVSYLCNNAVKLSNGANCPSTYTPGNSLSISLPYDGNSADIYFRYTPIPCTVRVDPASQTIANGAPGTVTASVNSGLGTATVNQYNFSSSDTSVATVNATAGSTASTTVNAVKSGNVTITATANLNDGRTCTADTTVNANNITVIILYSISGTIFNDTSKRNDTYYGKIVKDSLGSLKDNYTGAITISPSGGNLTRPTTSTYKISNLPAGQYTITFGGLSAGWGFTYPPPTPLYSFSVYVGGSCPNNSSPAGQTFLNGASCDTGANLNNVINLNVGVTNNPDAWFQSVGADIRWDNSATYPNVPLGQKASLDGLPNMPGIIFTGKASPFALNQAAGQPISSTGWWVGGGTNYDLFTTSHSNIPTSYNFLLETAKGSNIAPKTTISSASFAANGLPTHGIYQTDNSGLTINAPVVFGAGNFGAGNFIILVNGNLNINSDITVPVGSTAVFSASGDITVAGGVRTLQGLYSADGSFTVGSNSNCAGGVADNKLDVAGTVVVNAGRGGGNFTNNRTLCGGNTTNPSVVFTQRPDFILNYPSMVKQTTRTWQDVAP